MRQCSLLASFSFRPLSLDHELFEVLLLQDLQVSRLTKPFRSSIRYRGTRNILLRSWRERDIKLDAWCPSRLLQGLIHRLFRLRVDQGLGELGALAEVDLYLTIEVPILMLTVADHHHVFLLILSIFFFMPAGACPLVVAGVPSSAWCFGELADRVVVRQVVVGHGPLLVQMPIFVNPSAKCRLEHFLLDLLLAVWHVGSP